MVLKLPSALQKLRVDCPQFQGDASYHTHSSFRIYARLFVFPIFLIFVHNISCLLPRLSYVILLSRSESITFLLLLSNYLDNKSDKNNKIQKMKISTIRIVLCVGFYM